MSYSFRSGYRKGDWPVYCDICGNKCWASDATRLRPETGRGGLLVCPDDVDPIDYGLVPYTVPAEKGVPTVNYLLPPAPTTYPGEYPSTFNYDTTDPLTTTPTQLLAKTLTIDQDSLADIDVYGFFTIDQLGS